MLVIVFQLGWPGSPAFCTSAFAPADVVEHVDSGAINWTSGIVRAVGVSSPVAIDESAGGAQERILKGAKANAHERLLLTARRVRITPVMTIGQVMDSTPRLAEELRSLIQSLPVANQQYLSDGTVSVEIFMPLFGGPAQLLLPQEIKQVQPIKAIEPPIKSETAPAGESETAGTAGQPPYTGWLLDARGTGARPAMTIAVRDESGRTVYGAAFVSREFAVHAGMTGYTTLDDPGLAVDRVGSHPLVSRVLRAVGETRTDLVVSNADAARLRSTVSHLAFLRECRVLVLVDTK